MSTFHKADLAESMVAKEGGYGYKTKGEALVAIDSVFKAIINAVKAGNNVQFIGLGTFGVVDIPSREYRNPGTNEKLIKPACKKLKFKVSKAFVV